MKNAPRSFWETLEHVYHCQRAYMAHSDASRSGKMTLEHMTGLVILNGVQNTFDIPDLIIKIHGRWDMSL